MDPVIIIGGGIGGLVLALNLHQAGLPCRVYEAAAEFRNLGVGINILPHAIRELERFDVPDAMVREGNEPHDFVFYASSGQLIYKEPAGRFAGYDYRHVSIHRGDLHAILLERVRERLGDAAVVGGHRCVAVEQDAQGVTVRFEGRDPVRGSVAIGCDGIRSAVRQQFHPDEGAPCFGGINMWRGVTPGRPFLGGKSVCRVGALATGKIVIYPMKNLPDGRQLINWVVEIVQDVATPNDWATPGRLEDFIDRFRHWHFDWLDIPAMFEQAETILEYPMCDRDPLTHWGGGRVTLLGDAAHPVYPRGGNGAAQAILDANAVARHLLAQPDAAAALAAYEAERIPATTKVILASRQEPPDTIINRVEAITGGRRFERIEDVIDPAELQAIARRYANIAGYDKASVNRPV